MTVTTEVIGDDIHIYHFISPWTWDEYLEVAEKMKSMVLDDSSLREGGIIVIGDYTEGLPLPRRSLTYYPRIIQQASALTIKRVIVIQTNPFGRSLLRIFEKLWGPVELADSLDEALRLAREVSRETHDEH